MNIADLKANPKNPRKVSAEKLKQLRAALAEFGDLSGIIYNRKSKQLVGGHQRVRLFQESDGEIVILEKFKKPTATGTVAEGFVLVNGERFGYREVSWPPSREKAANIAANKSAGDWDLDLLGDWMHELADDGLDLDLTMFDSKERLGFFEDEKPKKGKKENDGRVSSSAVKQFQLTFTEESADEFASLVEHFQQALNLDSVSDTVLEVLRLAKDSAES